MPFVVFTVDRRRTVGDPDLMVLRHDGLTDLWDAVQKCRAVTDRYAAVQWNDDAAGLMLRKADGEFYAATAMGGLH